MLNVQCDWTNTHTHTHAHTRWSIQHTAQHTLQHSAHTCFIVIVRPLVVLEVSHVSDALHLYLLLEQVLHVQKQNQGGLPKQVVVAYAFEEI